MKAVIPGANVKIFGRAVHSLSRIGDELYIEPLEHGLSLRTVNSSRSAYACFVFAPSFFIHYDGPPNTDTGDDDDEDALRCKIGMKSCVNVFKSLSSLEKTVDKCKININMDDARLVFQLYCRHGIVKTHNLAFIESETLQAVFSKDLTPNILTAQTRLLSDTVMNFQSNQEEISMIVNPQEVYVKNYIEDQADVSKAIRTQMRLSPEEFESFQVGVDTEVTFCLKELRAILGFSESANLPISIHFESPGKPIVFCLDSDPSFEANFVLATLADVSNTQVSSSQQSTQMSRTTNRNRSTTTQASRMQQTATRKRRSSEEHQLSTSKRHEPETNGNISTAPERQPSTSKPRSSRTANTAKLQAALDHLMNDDHPDVTMATTNHKPASSVAADNDNEEDSPVIPIQSERGVTQAPDQSGYLTMEDVHMAEEEEEDEVPGTPPKPTQFKSLFFGLSQASGAESQQVKDDTGHTTSNQLMVLAEDTDEDD